MRLDVTATPFQTPSQQGTTYKGSSIILSNVHDLLVVDNDPAHGTYSCVGQVQVAEMPPFAAQVAYLAA